MYEHTTSYNYTPQYGNVMYVMYVMYEHTTSYNYPPQYWYDPMWLNIQSPALSNSGSKQSFQAEK